MGKDRVKKKVIFVIAVIMALILVINFTVPEKLIRLRIDSAVPEKIEYTIVSWSIRPYTTGFLDENITLFKLEDGEWVSTRTEDYLRHDIGIHYPPFSRADAEYVPEMPLENGTYLLRFHGHVSGRVFEAETEFEVR